METAASIWFQLVVGMQKKRSEMPDPTVHSADRSDGGGDGISEQAVNTLQKQTMRCSIESLPS